MQINYDDFGLCRSCRTINIKSEKVCRRCNSTMGLMTIKEAVGTGLTGYLIAIGLFILGIFTLPFGLFFMFFVSIPVGVSNKNKLKQRELKYKNEAIALFNGKAKLQKRECLESYYNGLKHLKEDNYELGKEQFKLSLERGNQSEYSILGLAVSYYNLGEFSCAIPLLEGIIENEYVSSSSKELLARCYLFTEIKDDNQLRYLINTKDLFGYKLKSLITLKAASYICNCYNNSYKEYTYILKQALSIEENNINFLKTLCKMSFDQDEIDECLSYCLKVNFNIMDNDILKIYVRCLQSKAATTFDVIPIYISYLQIEPTDSDIRILLCQSYVKSKMFNDAINICKKGLLEESSIKLQYNLSLVYIMNQQIDNAIKELQDINSKLDNDKISYITKYDIYRLLGKCFMKKGMLEISLKQFLQSDKSEDTLELLYELGELFESKNDMKNARKCWEEIYSVDITFQDVSNKLNCIS